MNVEFSNKSADKLLEVLNCPKLDEGLHEESSHMPQESQRKLKDYDFLTWKIFRRIDNHIGQSTQQSDYSDYYDV
jgi:hypothetical protein